MVAPGNQPGLCNHLHHLTSPEVCFFVCVLRWNKTEKQNGHWESNPGHLACAASTELRHLDNHQPSQPSICTAWVIVKWCHYKWLPNVGVIELPHQRMNFCYGQAHTCFVGTSNIHTYLYEASLWVSPFLNRGPASNKERCSKNIMSDLWLPHRSNTGSQYHAMYCPQYFNIQQV